MQNEIKNIFFLTLLDHIIALKQISTNNIMIPTHYNCSLSSAELRLWKLLEICNHMKTKVSQNVVSSEL